MDNKYNLGREKKNKPATYRTLISPDVIDGIYEKLLNKMIVEKRYLDPTFSAATLAKEIGTNSRYISAAVSLRFGMNFCTLLSGYRVREALHILSDKHNADLTMQEVADRCGFNSRQSFYAAFYKTYRRTPKEYQTEVRAKQAGRNKKKTK